MLCKTGPSTQNTHRERLAYCRILTPYLDTTRRATSSAQPSWVIIARTGTPFACSRMQNICLLSFGATLGSNMHRRSYSPARHNILRCSCLPVYVCLTLSLWAPALHCTAPTGSVAYFCLAALPVSSPMTAAVLLFMANLQIATADLLCEGKYASLMQVHCSLRLGGVHRCRRRPAYYYCEYY